MRWTFLSPIFLLLTLLPAHAGHTPPKVLFRVYVQTTGEGMPANQAQTINIPPDGEAIQVRTFPEVTEHDLVDVQVDSSDAVHFHFNRIGQDALNVATAQNQGRIMVVTLNGYVVYAPIIDEQLSTGELIMPHHLDPKIVQLLQQEAQKNVADTARP